MLQKLFQNFFMPKIEKCVYYNIFTENVCSGYNAMQVVAFCKKCINFVE